MYKQLKRTEKIFILIYAFFCTFVPLNHDKHYEHELVTGRLDKTPKYDKKKLIFTIILFHFFSSNMRKATQRQTYTRRWRWRWTRHAPLDSGVLGSRQTTRRRRYTAALWFRRLKGS